MEFNLNSVYNIDFFEAAKSIEDKSIPVVITSPSFKDEDVPLPYYEWYDKFMKEIERICRGWAFVFNSASRLVEILRRYPDNCYHTMIWNKGRVKYERRYEPIFVYRYTEDWRPNMWSDVVTSQPIVDNGRTTKLHPYQDPLYVYRRIVSFIPKDRSPILDPFCGSGTLPVACKQTGHSFLAFEINQKYAEIARRRVFNSSRNLSSL